MKPTKKNMLRGIKGIPGNAKCKICGATDGLERHHLKPRSQGGKATRRNIVYLCRACHNWAEDNEATWGMMNARRIEFKHNLKDMEIQVRHLHHCDVKITNMVTSDCIQKLNLHDDPNFIKVVITKDGSFMVWTRNGKVLEYQRLEDYLRELSTKHQQNAATA